MEVHFRPEIESRIQALATKSGRAPNELIEDAMAGYFDEVLQIRETLSGRYDDLTGTFGVPGIPGVGISFGVGLLPRTAPERICGDDVKI